MKKCALHSLGCKVNSYETQAMQKMMESAGYEIVPFGEEIADIYIINTCSVTNIADRKSRQMIHKAKKLNPEAVVAAAGCYVESAGDNIDEDVDIVIGNNEKSHLIEILNEYFEHMDKEKSVDIGKATGFDELNIDSPLEHTRAYVKIQDGCNRFCSYCIIPYVRGRIRSRKPDDVMAEIKRVAASGCKEVVLTGIHLSSYGLDFKDSTVKLIDVIEAANRIEGIERIRLGSLEPLIVTEEFARRLAKCKKICPHFHLSLQSGCDETLKRMNRRYNVDEYYKGVELLREYFPDAAVTTDVIVGFPVQCLPARCFFLPFPGFVHDIAVWCNCRTEHFSVRVNIVIVNPAAFLQNAILCKIITLTFDGLPSGHCPSSYTEYFPGTEKVSIPIVLFPADCYRSIFLKQKIVIGICLAKSGIHFTAYPKPSIFPEKIVVSAERSPAGLQFSVFIKEKCGGADFIKPGDPASNRSLSLCFGPKIVIVAIYRMPADRKSSGIVVINVVCSGLNPSFLCGSLHRPGHQK